MRRLILTVVLAVTTVSARQATFPQDADDPLPADLETTMAGILSEWPKRLVMPKEWTTFATAAAPGPVPVPAPSFTQPFEIGEALNDPSRVEDAVVSLLALMRIAIVPDGAPMRPRTGGERLKMTEAEVRGLISMGIADAEAAATGTGETFTFGDLHRALAPGLPDISVQQLAERYAQTYAQNRDWLVPQVLQGRPVEADMPLLRTQLWILLADAVGPPATPATQGEVGRSGAQLVLAVARVAPRQALNWVWGTGAILPHPGVIATPDARFTNAEWQEIMMRLPAFASGLLALGPARAHKKHSGSGSAVRIQGRIAANRPALVSSITGRILLAAASSSFSLAGLPIAWNYDPNLLDHGTMSVPQWTQTSVGASGVAELSFDPNNEPANGKGELMRDSGRVMAYMSPRDVVIALYNLPAAAHNMVWGQYQVGQTTLTVEWHSLDTIDLHMYNEYRVRIVGALQRDGVDSATGKLELTPDGTYRGRVMLIAAPSRTVLPGTNCRHGGFLAAQYATAIGTPITEQDSRGQREGAFYSFVRSSPKFFEWDAGKPANYLRLEFYPDAPPGYFRLDKAGNYVRRSGHRCYTEIGGVVGPSGVMTPKFIPLNAAQWTVPNAGYALAIPTPGEELAYKDLTGAGKFFQSGKTIGGAVQQLAAGTDSKWYIRIEPSIR
jgi:hypothetical protein